MQEYNYNGKLIIGVDHGYGNMKTAHRVFKTGIDELAEAPIVSENYLEYGGKYYVIGESHLTYQGDKTETEDFFLLTLAAIGEELAFRGRTQANIYLAVGLPLAWAKSQGRHLKSICYRSRIWYLNIVNRDMKYIFVMWLCFHKGLRRYVNVEEWKALT